MITGETRMLRGSILIAAGCLAVGAATVLGFVPDRATLVRAWQNDLFPRAPAYTPAPDSTAPAAADVDLLMTGRYCPFPAHGQAVERASQTMAVPSLEPEDALATAPTVASSRPDTVCVGEKAAGTGQSP